MPSHDILRLCPLFSGMSDTEIDAALAFFGASDARFRKGEYIKRAPESMPRFGLLLSGRAQVYSDDRDGRMLLIHSVAPGGSFGEALCYLGRESPVYIVASEATNLVWLDPARLLDPSPLAFPLLRRYAAMLAERALQTAERVRILSKPTLRGKVAALLRGLEGEKGRSFLLPMTRAETAAFLGCDRSALSRELSHMQAAGLIEYKGRTFCFSKDKPPKPVD